MARRLALALIAVVVLAAYAVPYLVLTGIAAWYGSLLFWLVSGLAIIALNAVATAPFSRRRK